MLPIFVLLCLIASAFAQEPYIMRRDLSAPVYIFRYPDAFGSDWRNQRFTAPEPGQLLGAYFCFGGREGQFTTGSPEAVWRVWDSNPDTLPDGGRPNQILATVNHDPQLEIAYHHLDSTWVDSLAPWVYADFSDLALTFATNAEFHIGYSLQNVELGDSLAIMADNGNPETDYASEWSGGEFRFLFESWRGSNLFIRALYAPASTLASPQVLLPASFKLQAYPNPFNSTTRIEWSALPPTGGELILTDILGRQIQTWNITGAQSSFEFDAARFATGRYFLTLSHTTGSVTLPLLYLK